MNDRITINVGKQLLDRAIPIGRVGENIVSEIEWNIGVWQEQFGDGILELLVQRNKDNNPYPVALIVNGNSAVWVISDTDTAVQGRGQLQLVYRVGEKIKKSVIYEFICRVSLGATGPVPDGYSDWLEALSRVAAQAQEDSQAANVSAQAAKASEEAAQGALAGMTFVGFAVNADGHVVISNSDLLGTTSFELKESGHMEVTY